MARRLRDKTNVIPPDSSFIYGRIRDDDGSNNGTPVDEEVYGDFHQFFEALMTDAGIPFNNLPDNFTNGFQLHSAFRGAVRNVTATTSLYGTALKSDNAAVQAGTDDESFVTPLTLTARTATETRTGLAEVATQAEVNGGTDDERIVTALKLKTTTEVMHITGGIRMKTKVLDINDWNMNSDQTVDVTHGIADFTAIRTIEVTIRNDANDRYYKLEQINPTSGVMGGGVSYFDASVIRLARRDSGVFDGTTFQNTGYNRGWVTVTYIE